MSSSQNSTNSPRNPHSVILAISAAVLFAISLGSAAAEPCLDPPLGHKEVESQAKAAPASDTIPSPVFADPGGTVYSLLDVGPYVTDPTDANWKLYAKSIIGYYHTNPEKVRAQLADMRKAGQKRIGILIWFVSGSLTMGGTNWMHTVVPFPDGRLGTQHLANIAGFLKDVDNAGFAEVQIRIATQGYAGPSDYRDDPCTPTSTGPCIADAASFTWQVEKGIIDHVEKLGLKVSRLYDVAPQKAGHPYLVSDPKMYDLVFNVWKSTSAYMKTTGIRATISFCRADPLGSEYTFRIFDTLGYPSIISIDIYSNLYANLVNLANAMTNHWKTGSPVFIQETFFNDAQSASEIRKAMTDKKLNIQYVMQWPLTRAGWAAGPVGRVTDVVNLSPYDSFLRYSNNSPYFYPVITGAGLGCSSRQCIWLTGAFSISGCQVALYAGDWRNGSTAEVVLDASKREAFCKADVVTFVIPPDLRAKYPSLNVVVLNASNPLRTTWSTPRLVPIR